MLKKTAALLVMTSALAAGTAYAQTTTAPTNTTPAPATTAPMNTTAPATTAPMSTTAPMTTTQAGGMSGKFVTAQTQGEFRASKFMGLDIYGSENEKVGDINEILVDGNGQAKGIVIGVGGFLGIGEKSVAVPWSSVKWVNEKPAGGSTAATTTSTAPAPAGTTTTGTTATSTAATTQSPAEMAAYNGYPDHGMIQMTKAELKDAPAFQYYSDTHSKSGAPSNANTAPATTTAPKQ